MAIAGALGTTGVAATLTAGLTLASAGVGLASGISGLRGSAVKAVLPNLPNVPKPEDSLAKAEADAQQRQKTRLSSGGQTNFTGPMGAQVSAGNLQMHTLLGV